jgi:hypothetical protein
MVAKRLRPGEARHRRMGLTAPAPGARAPQRPHSDKPARPVSECRTPDQPGRSRYRDRVPDEPSEAWPCDHEVTAAQLRAVRRSLAPYGWHPAVSPQRATAVAYQAGLAGGVFCPVCAQLLAGVMDHAVGPSGRRSATRSPFSRPARARRQPIGR